MIKVEEMSSFDKIENAVKSLQSILRGEQTAFLPRYYVRIIEGAIKDGSTSWAELSRKYGFKEKEMVRAEAISYLKGLLNKLKSGLSPCHSSRKQAVKIILTAMTIGKGLCTWEDIGIKEEEFFELKQKL